MNINFQNLKLIDMVRITRKHDHRYFAVDKDDKVYSYPERHKPHQRESNFNNKENHNIYIGKTNINCNWKDTLIDVEKILVK